MEEVRRARYVGRAWYFYVLSRHATLLASSRVHLEAFYNLSFWDFMEAWLIKSLANGNWTPSPILLPTWRSGEGEGEHRERPESSKPLITWLILLATSPQEGIQNHLHWMNKRYLDHSQHLGNSKGLGSCEPKTVDKDKTLYKSQYCRVDYNLTWTLWEWKWALLIIRSR